MVANCFVYSMWVVQRCLHCRRIIIFRWLCESWFAMLTHTTCIITLNSHSFISELSMPIMLLKAFGYTALWIWSMVLYMTLHSLTPSSVLLVPAKLGHSLLFRGLDNANQSVLPKFMNTNNITDANYVWKTTMDGCTAVLCLAVKGSSLNSSQTNF